MELTGNLIHECFELQVKNNPDAIAVLFEGSSLSYYELNKKANQLACHLLKMGIKPEEQVALCMERCLDMLVVIMAILKAGGAYVPLDPTHPEERLLAALNGNAAILITKSRLREKFSLYQGESIFLDLAAGEIEKHPDTNPQLSLAAENLAYIIYTSGSTGKPKGVLIEHKSVLNYCRWFVDYCACKAQQRIDFSANYIFDMMVTNTLIPLMSGLTIVIADDETKKDPAIYLEFIRKNKINLIKMTPGYFKLILNSAQHSDLALPQLQTVVLGGESLSAADCESWLSLFPQQLLINEYGPTETTVGVSLYQVPRQTKIKNSAAQVPIGIPGDNISFYLLDADRKPVLCGETGELYIGGACLARGYLNQENLTCERFINNPFETGKLYKTGDLCRQLADGLYEHIGRIDQQIKIRGYRIEMGEIEKRLNEHPQIREAIVIARKTRQDEKQLLAYYIASAADSDLSTEELRKFLGVFLPVYMIPAAFVKIDKFPLTDNGKLDREALPVPKFASSRPYLASSTVLERKLAKLWSEELEVDVIGMNDDFFELGGHSLAAARIIAQIKQLFGKDIALKDFYKAPCIAKLAVLIKSTAKSRKITPVLANSVKILPLSDFQLLLWLANTFAPGIQKLNVAERKRFRGKLDLAALRWAFSSLFKRHEILNYRILKHKPAQCLSENLPGKLTEENLEHLSEEACEQVLTNSFDALIHHYPWHKNSPLLLGKLFYLKEDIIELQLSMPHFIADNYSPQILFADLSRLYLHAKKQPEQAAENVFPAPAQYKDHLFQEQQVIQTNLERDFAFWEEYLKDAELFSFPPEKLVKNMAADKLAYSSYTEIPEQNLRGLQYYCASMQVNINDVLCAALSLALINCSDGYEGTPQKFILNIVKSTRDNQLYDNTPGCFLRIEPIKIDLTKTLSIRDLAWQVHQSKLETAHCQQSSGIMKLACINPKFTRKNKIRDNLISFFTHAYTRIFPELMLHHKLSDFCARLASFNKRSEFMINIDIAGNFMFNDKRKNEKNLFELATQKVPVYHYDLLQVDYVLDVYFLRDSNQIPWLVISGNLAPEFRKKIAREIIKIIQHETGCHDLKVNAQTI